MESLRPIARYCSNVDIQDSSRRVAVGWYMQAGEYGASTRSQIDVVSKFEDDSEVLQQGYRVGKLIPTYTFDVLQSVAMIRVATIKQVRVRVVAGVRA